MTTKAATMHSFLDSHAAVSGLDTSGCPARTSPRTSPLLFPFSTTHRWIDDRAVMRMHIVRPHSELIAIRLANDSRPCRPEERDDRGIV